MKNDLATAAALSDHELLARLDALASRERDTVAELVAHLAVLDARPAVFAAQGFGSLFSYCTDALRLSEDAACSRIEVARACREFPAILELLACGALSLTSVRLIRRHLTTENHETVLARARGCSRREIELLVAELAPRPDVPSTVRKVPASPAETVPSSPDLPIASAAAPTAMTSGIVAPRVVEPSSTPAQPTRPIVQPTAPGRYRVQFTIGAETHARLERLQALLRREIPSGDPAVIFDRALALLLERVEKKKLAAVHRPRTSRSIRPGTDKARRPLGTPADMAAAIRTPIVESRDIPNAVKRAVWRRDGGQCAYVAPTGRRCTERTFLEFHHVLAYARHGAPTVANISLRCRHNQYDAELVFGPDVRRTLFLRGIRRRDRPAVRTASAPRKPRPGEWHPVEPRRYQARGHAAGMTASRPTCRARTALHP